MVHQILVASYTNDISTLSFDSERLSLTVTSKTTIGHHPSWIVFHPNDRSVVFTALEQSEGRVVVLKYGSDGKGTVVAEAPSGGADPCSLYATKDELFVSNYSAGILSIFSISPNAPYILSSSPRKVTLTGTGPNIPRQLESHPHQVFMLDQHSELLVPDLGADTVNRFKKAEDGSWAVYGTIRYEPGSGPRHVAYHDGYLYTLLELTSSVTKHRLPAIPGVPTLLSSTPSMSNPPPLPNDMLAAEILIPPPNAAFPNPYLYVSNRNDPSPDGDFISIFAINGEALELVNEVRSGLQHVRGMVFGGPDDKWLIAGGVNGGGVKVFERTHGGKELKLIAELATVEAATGFLWV